MSIQDSVVLMEKEILVRRGRVLRSSCRWLQCLLGWGSHQKCFCLFTTVQGKGLS